MGRRKKIRKKKKYVPPPKKRGGTNATGSPKILKYGLIALGIFLLIVLLIALIVLPNIHISKEHTH